MTDLHPIAAEGYGHGAQSYARGRPGFPPQALEWLENDLQLRPGKTALELGAGTGKFTSVLAQTGAQVLAVEPVAAMLERLAADLPRVQALRATAQNLPLAVASVDAVVCAQSFHWFATPAALADIHRVLKPGGMLGLIWNVRDRSVAWVEALTRILERHEGDAPRYDDHEWRAVFPARGFGPFAQKSVAHAHTGSVGQVIVERMASVSFIAALPEQVRQSVLEEVRALVVATPELVGKSAVTMPYVTTMYWCRVGDVGN